MDLNFGDVSTEDVQRIFAVLVPNIEYVADLKTTQCHLHWNGDAEMDGTEMTFNDALNPAVDLLSKPLDTIFEVTSLLWLLRHCI